MNPAETPIDTLRSLRAKPETRTAPRSGSELATDVEYAPRFVDVPRHRRMQLAAARNLTWGLAMLLLAFGLIGAALIFSGPWALAPVALCLITFTVLWVLARIRVFHQRNGVFFAAALICLLGASVPLIECGYIELNRMAHKTPVDATSVLAGPASGASMEPEPVLEKLTERPVLAAPVLGSSPVSESEPPSLVDTFNIKLPDDASAALVRVIENTSVVVKGKPYLLHAGDIFVLDHIGAGQVAFQANDLRLSLPERAVEIMQSQPADPDGASSSLASDSAIGERPPGPQSDVAASDKDALGTVTSRAQAEAVRRYPAIGVKGSPENEIFLQRFNRLKTERPEFFEDEEWPIYLAEAVAKEEGWQRVK